MVKLTIRCREFKSTKWVGEQTYEKPNGKHCANCHALYCAKNREYIFEEK